MNKKWMVYAKRADFEALARRFGIDPVIARIMRNRDLTDEAEMEAYLRCDLSGLYDGRQLPQIGAAAELLMSALRKGRHIRVVGDYDIDGVCATCILVKGLSALREAAGAPEAVVDYAIPDRIRDGYGINEQIIDRAEADGVQLLLTCDNGIAAIEELRHAKELGMTVIVTDHHDVRMQEDGAEASELLPPADAIVNPKLAESRYPTKGICGAVVAWKLVGLLYARCGLPESEWLAFLEFAAIATVGDVMPLREENRVIVKHGLMRINQGAVNPGLCALIEACGLSGKNISAYHIGFVIGPCINAGGRLETAETALRLFLSADRQEAARLAEHLRALNDERKAMTEAGVSEAAEQAETLYPEDRVLVLYLPKLHESLAGIVAGRIRERCGKPCFVLTDGESAVKGSGRSIEAYHMFQGLCRADDLLLKYGGHPMAAGLSLEREQVAAFRERVNETCGLTEEDFVQTLWIDVPMPISYLSERLIRELSQLEPFGNGNEKPVFAAKNIRLDGYKVLGKARNVLRCRAVDESGYAVSALMFGEADRMLEELSAKQRYSIIYDPQINEYNGQRSLQIVIREYRPQ